MDALYCTWTSDYSELYGMTKYPYISFFPFFKIQTFPVKIMWTDILYDHIMAWGPLTRPIMINKNTHMFMN